MFCTNCGAIIEQQARFCAACGTPSRGGFPASPTLAGRKTPTRSRAFEIGVVVFALLSVMGTCMYAAFREHTTSPTSASQPPSEVRHKCGDDVIVGYWAYHCLTTSWQNAIGSQYARQHPDAEFLVVD